MTLTEFLLARIAEDEDVARDAAGWDLSGRQRASGQWSRVGMGSLEDDQRQSVVYSDNNQVSGGVADHIARHDPARVLAECEAKRRIVEQHEWLPGFRDHDRGECRTCGWARGESCPTVLQLAAVYAAHADYRPEWKP